MRHKNEELMEQMITYINDVYFQTGHSPSYREIANHFSITPACVSNYVNEMESRKMLSYSKQSRSIVTDMIRKQTNNTVQVPIVGSIACGTPLLAEQNIEMYITLPISFISSGEFFILRARGHSMKNAGIVDGDYVLVKKQESADEGQIVVALIDNEATLKRFFINRNERKIVLHPENEEMKDMYFDNISIQGVVKKVIKDVF